MFTPFPDWLQQLSRAGKRIPDGSITIDRGLPFKWPFALEGDWSEATVAASLRLYPDAAGAPLAALDVTGTSFDSSSNLTTFAVSLTETQTETLPADTALDGIVQLAFDVLLTPLGSIQFRLMGGVATVAGKVTNGS